ncbi:MAG: Fis family transcriptional regulator [Alphaproteobacteria bacterium]|nr:MAG: Fis family transcriptional regulator [Alphaproteobacteria bacterium]
MALQTLLLSQIKQSNNNPRTTFNDESIMELAQSIKTDGLLQNLVVLKPKGKKKAYSIISGERRFRALNFLVEEGFLAEDYEVAVEVREGLNKNEVLRLSTVENLQREDMHPMDEAHAIASLVHNGSSVDDISALTGLSPALIKRRVILTDLCEAVQEALRLNEISIGQGEALTLGTVEQQQELLERGLDDWSNQDIKDTLTEEKANVAMAIFPMEHYTGTLTHDLFATDDATFFDDREQFLELQEVAIEVLKLEKEEQGFSPVEIHRDSYLNLYQYRDAEEEEKGGVIVHFHPSGRVSIHEGLVSRALDRSVTDDIAQAQEKKPKPSYSRPVMEYMAMHKSIAVQSALLSNPRKAKEVAVMQLLRVRGSRVSLEEHKCLGYFPEDEPIPSSLAIVQEQEKKVLDLLNAENFEFYWKDAFDIYESIKLLSDEELDMVHLFMTTLCFGQYETDILDTKDNSFFNLVAKDLNIDMNQVWYPDGAFLKKRNKIQLAEIVATTKSTLLFGTVANWKKGDLVKKLAEHFKRIFETGAKTPEEEAALAWLPEAMSFPAIDPAEQENIEAESFDGHGDFEEDEECAQAA